ncbi:hypothetical protein [Actinomadura rubrisoli]|uniref:Uncharacterized protein n=1 Tax=Actinomadura rubrisoli TaxID=2530368 RepID=A0A4R5BAI3_9ACTN|nr:hypothetical protein [Actinomadura rubrisoli]TDD82203.1 hypothetical protein E1298_23025 [Actinomadura rubrisoli]
MSETSFGLLRDVAARLERAIRSRDGPAIVALEGRRRLVLGDYDHLHDDQAAHAFEDRAGEHARRVGPHAPLVWPSGCWSATATNSSGSMGKGRRTVLDYSRSSTPPVGGTSIPSSAGVLRRGAASA